MRSSVDFSVFIHFLLQAVMTILLLFLPPTKFPKRFRLFFALSVAILHSCQAWMLGGNLPTTPTVTTTRPGSNGVSKAAITATKCTRQYPSRVGKVDLVAAAALTASSSSTTPPTIDYQADYGRGVDHLTATLDEGDVVVFQSGTWHVDGVAVGDGQPAAWHYCLVDSVQIVWSHNCEHGVVRGFGLTTTVIMNSEDENETAATLLHVDDFDTMIDFGPEQLVARIPVQQESKDSFQSLVLLSDDLWRQKAESPSG